MAKSEVKELLGHSPDFSDALMMRMYFEYTNPEVVTAFDRARMMVNKNNLTKSWSE